MKSPQTRPLAEKPDRPATNMTVVARAAGKGMAEPVAGGKRAEDPQARGGRAAHVVQTDPVAVRSPKTASQAAGETQTDNTKASGVPTASQRASAVVTGESRLAGTDGSQQPAQAKTPRLHSAMAGNAALTVLRAAPAAETVRVGAEKTGRMASEMASLWNGQEPTPVSPTPVRALAAFRKAGARGMPQPKASQAQSPMAPRAFSVERSTGGEIVVGRKTGQAATVVIPGGDVPDAAMLRSGAAHGGTGPAQTLQVPAGAEVADQLAESIRASGTPMGRQIIVQLHPPELGRVRIMFRNEGGAVRGVVRVDNPETLSRLEREAAPLVQRLQASGIEVRRLDVMLNDSHDGDTTQNPAFREGQDRQNGWVGDNPSGSLSGDASADAGQTTAESTTADPDAGIGGGAINVRI